MSPAHQLDGIKVHTTDLCPEFIQTVKLRPCGCSDDMLSRMNAWLLAKFGRRRQVININGQYLVMNPKTLDHFRSLV